MQQVNDFLDCSGKTGGIKFNVDPKFEYLGKKEYMDCINDNMC